MTGGPASGDRTGARSEVQTGLHVVAEVEHERAVERAFTIPVEGVDVPGIRWLPKRHDGPRPTVCIGHGGFQHKRIENVLELALQLVANLDVGVVSLDAPGHGDRVSDPDAVAAARAALARGDREEVERRYGAKGRAAMAARAKVHVAEWKVLLDALERDAEAPTDRFGWWGVSMGTTHGLPLGARDDRIRAAVFGLNALVPGDERWAALASSVTIPVLFLCQSDDELMTRDAALGLWDALGSEHKTLHLNPGGHVQVPRFERDETEAFFRRHLL